MYTHTHVAILLPCFQRSLKYIKGFPGGSVVKNLPANAEEASSIPGSGRSPGVGNPLQYSFLGNPMDRRAWWAIVHGVAKQLDKT